MKCNICGMEYSSPSMGGPGVCPACDCGYFGLPQIQAQAKRIAQLEAALRKARNVWHNYRIDSTSVEDDVLREIDALLGLTVETPAKPHMESQDDD